MTKKDISVKEGGMISFSNSELAAVGCRNCVWKFHGQCPHGLKGKEAIVHKEGSLEEFKKQDFHPGICEEMVNFLLSLAEKGDTTTAVWEKYHIYKARLQESEDYKDYLRLENEIKEKEEDKTGSEEELKQLKLDKTAAKMWWIRLNEHVIKSLQKVNDRDVKKKGPAQNLPGIMSAKTINFNVTKELEDKSNDKKN